MRIRFLVFLSAGTLVSAAMALAQAPVDGQLAHLQEQFKRQRSNAHLIDLAAYADQLRALRESLKKSDPASAAKVNEELAGVLRKLAGVMPVPVAAISTPAALDPKMEAGPVGTPESGATSGKTTEAPATEKTAAIFPPDGVEFDARAKRITLTAREAVGMTNPKNYDSDYWSSQGAKLKWKLSAPEVAPGVYRVFLNYTAAEKQGGGKGKISISDLPEAIPFEIIGRKTWKSPERIAVAKIELSQLPQELTVSCVSVAEGAYSLFDLRSVVLVAESESSGLNSSKPGAKRSPGEAARPGG